MGFWILDFGFWILDLMTLDLVTGHWSLVTGHCSCQQTAKYVRIVSNYGSYSALIRNNFAFFSLSRLKSAIFGVF
ncbi:hypothetical protein WA1_44495 [Scytonema hofmannii PCC 7110]|uniref:Uncharacterized protein n=1 Tax=Scytonema hofmannii PCC 7110 TaxID=128403 RepID=A0A139WWC8_9CYAN|nr:hypothetical protein WA1_44495 [Scytonema hofmannii PCC 7110]